MQYCGDDVGALVIDYGSKNFKCGYAGDDSPCVYINSAAGKVLHTENTDNNTPNPPLKKSKQSELKVNPNTNENEIFVGSRLNSSNKNLQKTEIHSVISSESGLIEDWDAFESLLSYSIKDTMKLEFSEHPLLISERPYNTVSQRERLSEILFEKFDLPAIFFAKSSVLSSFAVGRQTSLIVDVGASQACVCPVYDGYALCSAIRKSFVAGDCIDFYLKNKILGEEVSIEPRFLSQTNVDKTLIKPSFYRHFQMELVRDMKESMCYVYETNPTLVKNLKINNEKIYELPDKSIIKLDSRQRFQAPEILFANTEIETETQNQFGNIFSDYVRDFKTTETPTHSPLQNLIIESIMASDADVRKELVNSIILTGGTTYFEGFGKRVYEEVNRLLTPALNKLRIVQPNSLDERKFGA